MLENIKGNWKRGGRKQDGYLVLQYLIKHQHIRTESNNFWKTFLVKLYLSEVIEWLSKDSTEKGGALNIKEGIKYNVERLNSPSILHDNILPQI